jgi:hypothetical protein
MSALGPHSLPDQKASEAQKDATNSSECCQNPEEWETSDHGNGTRVLLAHKHKHQHKTVDHAGRESMA